MRAFLLLLLLLLLFVSSGCGPVCGGIHSERDSQGKLVKYRETPGTTGCLKENLPLSRWEQTNEAWKGGCKPQTSPSMSLVSSSNFYSYRDGKIYLDLDSSTGEYRKLTLAESKDGPPLMTRLRGCFYERSGQLLLDTRNVVSDQYFDPMEIFTYTESSASMEMVRFDDSQEWGYRECPTLDTPWGVCDLLRNGNEMYFPVLNSTQQADLLAEALLVRRQFNFSKIPLSKFWSAWDQAEESRVPSSREGYKFAIQTVVDTPRYIDQAWASYVRGDRPIMPDLTENRMPPVCYPGKRPIVLPDGSTGTIYGEICYIDGVYTFQ